MSDSQSESHSRLPHAARLDVRHAAGLDVPHAAGLDVRHAGPLGVRLQDLSTSKFDENEHVKSLSMRDTCKGARQPKEIEAKRRA